MTLYAPEAWCTTPAGEVKHSYVDAQYINNYLAVELLREVESYKVANNGAKR